MLSSPKNSWNLLLCCFHWNSLKYFLWTFLLPPLKLKCRNLEGAPWTLNSIKQLKDWWRSCYHLCWQHGLEARRSIWSSYNHFFFARGELGKLIECYFQMLQCKDLFLWIFVFFSSSSPKFLELLLQSGILLPKSFFSWTMLWSLMYIIVVMWLLLQSISISFLNVCLEIYL